MEYEILAVGSELVSGDSSDTNSSYISQKLTKIGFGCLQKQCIADDLKEVSRAIEEVLRRRDVLVITGGLGPTADDLTREAAAHALEKELILDKKLADILKKGYRKRKESMPEFVLKQAYLLKGALPIKPVYKGAAPGMIIELDKEKVVFLLPGVPKEMKWMLEKRVIPYLSGRFSEKEVFSRTIKIFGLRETEVVGRMKGIKIPQDVSLAILPHLGEVHLKLTSKAREPVLKIEDEIKALLGEGVYGFDEDTLESVVGKLLKKSELKLSIAESCTGGLLSHRITEVPGSSKYFLGGIVAYSNELKKNLLHVSSEILLKFGAVSSECARAMAEGVREVAQTDLGMSITGIAGPSGASKEKPIGLTFIALSSKEKKFCRRFDFLGERGEIKFQASQEALDMLRRFLIKIYSKGGKAA